MMTPNEAAKQVNACYETCSERLPSKLEDIIKQIQFDAMKEGARKAAKVYHNSIQPQGPYFKSVILAALCRSMDREKPMPKTV